MQIRSLGPLFSLPALGVPKCLPVCVCVCMCLHVWMRSCARLSSCVCVHTCVEYAFFFVSVGMGKIDIGQCLQLLFTVVFQDEFSLWIQFWQAGFSVLASLAGQLTLVVLGRQALFMSAQLLCGCWESELWSSHGKPLACWATSLPLCITFFKSLNS